MPRKKIHLPKDRLRQLYKAENKTQAEIGKYFGCSESIVYQRLKEYGITRRTHKENMEIVKKRKLSAGNKHWNWSGGRAKNKDGYIVVLLRDHRLANSNGRVMEHRLIWEMHHGELPDGWLVHHLNGIRDDNRIENLEAMPRKSHHPYLFVQMLQKRIRVLERALEEWAPLALLEQE